MTAYTTYFDIPYPLASDTPCSVGEEIAAAVQLLDGSLYDLSEYVHLTAHRPYVLLHAFDVTVDTSASNEAITWQAVISSDRFPMDLVRNDTSFPTPFDGAYLGGGRVEVATTGSAGTEIIYSPSFTYATSQGCRDSSGTGNTAMCCMTSVDISSSEGTQNSMYVFPVSAATSLTISDAYAWLIRIGDSY